ncbi:hypothetical protein [Alkalihalobacterium elongatum]|uniref:hypothetical protein n=1 Tax=Alkalihalobacterium elongatum TaxID=2675466 RepID=UPI001C1F8F89|nr:hypothetical protein [Alkalihalobacterium elongatum]
MKLKIAIIGSKIPVNAIEEVINEYDQQLEVVSFVCKTLKEAPMHTIEAQKFADVIVYGGPIPYFFSKDVLNKTTRTVFLPYKGVTIYNTLMRIYMTYNFFPIISFEALKTADIDEVYEDLGLSHIDRYITVLGQDFDTEKTIEEHLKLWRKNKVQVIVTATQSTFERIKEMKIPVFLLKNTKQTIRETLDHGILMAIEKKKHLSQITVLKCQIDHYDKDASKEIKGEYEAIKDEVLTYGQQFFSVSGESSENIITLYMTRGILEKATNHLRNFSIINSIKSMYSQSISLGVGMGDTAEDATFNASKALVFAKEHGGDCVFLINEDKKIIGPLGSSNSIEYQLTQTDGLDNASSLTIRKFYAWMKMFNKNQITTRDVKIGMNTSARHATRILKSLQDKGIVQVIGKETMSHKGRPRQIYEVNLAKLENEV